MGTVNEEAKNYFDRVGGDYWQVWDSLAKRDISNFELTIISRVLAEDILSTTPFNVLEVGTGPGRIAEQILKHNVNYYGADISSSMLNSIKEKFVNNSKVKGLVVCNIGEEAPFPDLKFDCIVAWRVLYYLENWEKVIGRLTPLLSPGGLLVFSMLNRRSTALLGKFFGGQLKGYYTDYDQLREVLNKNRFTDVEITGYARLPDVTYDWASHPALAKAISLVENSLRFLLGETFLARMFYVTARK